MDLARQLVLLLHLVGFAALFGGCLVQLRARAPEVNAAMLHGALIQVVSGAALVVLLGPGNVDHVKVAVKGAIALVVAVLVVANRRYASIPRGLWALVSLLSLAGAAVAALWR